jgi:TubC N-terminal docking domain
MTPSDLLMTLIERGVRLKAVDDRLVYAAPHGTMTAKLVEQLREHKAEVVAQLARRSCTTCGSVGRCERRVPMEGGGWTCQATLDAGLLSNAETEADRQRRRERDLRPRVWYEQTRQTGPQPVEANAGCGERVPVRTAGGRAWVRCTGPETCDGVCTRAELRTEAAS